MNDLHKTFEPLEAPGHIHLRNFLETYSHWAQDNTPNYRQFDFLAWPDLVSWTTVVHFPAGPTDRYAPENSRILFDGSARVDMFSGDMTNLSAADLEDTFLRRWLPIYNLCIAREVPVFARSWVYGVGKDYVQFEVGLFPFTAGDGSLSHVVCPALRTN